MITPVALVIQAREQRVREPLIVAVSKSVRQGVDRLERIVDNENVATKSGQRRIDGCRPAKSAAGREYVGVRLACNSHLRKR